MYTTYTIEAVLHNTQSGSDKKYLIVSDGRNYYSLYGPSDRVTRPGKVVSSKNQCNDLIMSKLNKGYKSIIHTLTEGDAIDVMAKFIEARVFNASAFNLQCNDYTYAVGYSPDAVKPSPKPTSTLSKTQQKEFANLQLDGFLDF
jgi:hypothetical protein